MVPLEYLYKGGSQKLPFKRIVLCSKCKGTGETIDKDFCQQCKGVKVVKEKKVVEVHIEKGMQNGQMITFPGEDEALSSSYYRRSIPSFSEMVMISVEHTLSLTEALSGFQFKLTHLDNRQLIIKSQPGEVVKPDQVKEINDEGMPMYQKPFMRGKLCIRFKVEFPGSPTPDQSKAIQEAYDMPGCAQKVQCAKQ